MSSFNSPLSVLILIVATLSLAQVAVVGCGVPADPAPLPVHTDAESPDQAEEAELGPKTSPEWAIVTPVTSPQPTLTVVICLDTTGSFPPALFEQAKQRLATWMEQLVREGMPETILYIQLIGEQSYRPQATLLVVRVEADGGALLLRPTAVPTRLPARTPTPTSTGSATVSPFRKGTATAEHATLEAGRARLEATRVAQRSATATAEVRETAEVDAQGQAALRQALDKHRDRLARARTDMAKAARDLRNLDFPASPYSDVSGCFERAAERLQAAAGRKVLLVVSDLERSGVQQVSPAGSNLRGVEVHLLWFHCERAEECQRRREEWKTLFEESGAAVTVRDPAQSLILDNPLR